jgi:hypothetical protein
LLASFLVDFLAFYVFIRPMSTLSKEFLFVPQSVAQIPWGHIKREKGDSLK